MYTVKCRWKFSAVKYRGAVAKSAFYKMNESQEALQEHMIWITWRELHYYIILIILCYAVMAGMYFCSLHSYQTHKSSDMKYWSETMYYKLKQFTSQNNVYVFSYCGVKLLGDKVFVLVHWIRKKLTALCYCETVACYLVKTKPECTQRSMLCMCATRLKYTDNLDELGCLILWLWIRQGKTDNLPF